MMMSSFDVLTVFWRASWQAAMLAALVFAVCSIFQRSISASAKTLLWTLPILRLLVLVVPASSLSIFNVAAMLNGDETTATSHEQVSPQFPSILSSQSLSEAVQFQELEVNTAADEVPNVVVPSLATVTPSVVNNSARMVTLADGLVAIWLLGIAACLIQYLGAQIVLHKAIASGRVVPLDEILPDESAAEFYSKPVRRARFVIVDSNLGPAVAGFLRPAVLLPKQMVDRYSQDELKMVILHELEHIRRHDTLLLFVAQIATIVHWCNPLVYWLKRHVQAQAEIAVDAATVRNLGADKVRLYAELLFRIASVNRTPTLLLSMARKSSTFRRRLEQLAECEHSTPLRKWVGALAVASIALTGLSDATSQERPTTAPTVAASAAASELPIESTEDATQQQENQVSTNESQKPNEALVTTETPVPKAIEAQQPEAQTTADLKQAETRTVSGRVVDSQGKGVPNASLFRTSWIDSSRADCRATTDQNGEFTLPIPKNPQRMDLLTTWVFAEGFSLRGVSLYAVIQGEGNISGVSIPLPPLASKPTRVQVLDPNGAPIVGALVCPARIQLPNGRFLANEPRGLVSHIPSEILESLAVRTDKEGRATFDHFADGLWDGVACRTTEFGLQEFEYANQGNDMQLQLLPVGSIRGKIAKADAAQFKQFSYSIQTRIPVRGGLEVEGVAYGVIDDQGEFHVPAIAAGRINSFHVSSADKSMQDIELTCDNYSSKSILPNSTLELKLEAPPTVPVSGIVLTSDTRKPVSGAVISYSRFGSPHYRNCTTDENGEFRINMVPGKARFQMISLGDSVGRSGRYGYSGQFPEEITKETKLEILLPVNKQVKGKLQDAAGRPIPNQKIARHSGVHQHRYGLATTDAEGKFEMYLRYWPLEAGGYWAIVDKEESERVEATVVNQMSDDGDFFVLERPTVPVAPPTLKSALLKNN